jgi:UDP-glucose 4-epimerase
LLVTGGAGYIGATTAEYLCELGHDVTVLDNLTTGFVENVPDRATLVEGRVGDASLVRSLGRFDACVHFAGLIAPAQSMAEPERYFANNVAESFTLLESLIETGTDRFVFSSSCAVYGDNVTVPISEDHRTAPHSPYGESKLLVEHGLRWLVARGRLRAATLRYFNASGGSARHPERHEPEFHLIPLALAAANGDRDGIDLYGDDYPTRDGTCVRDYVNVIDLASAHALAIDALGRHEHLVVNLGTGTGCTNREVLDAVARVTGRSFEIRRKARRPGDPAEAVAANAHARTVLGWDPRHSAIDEVVTDAWAAYLSQR